MAICTAMIDVSEAVYMLGNWKESPGAIRERFYAMSKEKRVIYEFPDNGGDAA